MRPHTCALIGVINYLHKKNSGNEFRVRVLIPSRANKPYTIRLKRKADRKIELEVSDRWSCQAEISVDGNRYRIEHQHSGNKYTIEEFTLYSSQLANGEHINPTVSRNFDGEISDEKRLEIRDRVRKIDYEVKIDNVY